MINTVNEAYLGRLEFVLRLLVSSPESGFRLLKIIANKPDAPQIFRTILTVIGANTPTKDSLAQIIFDLNRVDEVAAAILTRASGVDH